MAKIFVVDDEKDNLTILDLYLRQRGFETFLCNRSTTAFELILKEKPDLVILDIMMPEVDGFSVCKQIKANEKTSDIPVIFLTARYLDKKDLIQGLSLGAFDYITKPFDEGELYARINAALRIRFAERALKEQNQLLESILLHMSEGLFFLMSDKRVLIKNSKAKILLDNYGVFDEDKLLSFGELTSESLFESHRQSPGKTISHNISLGNDFFKINSSALTIEDTEGLIITIDNITSELKTQEELIQSAKLVSIGEMAASIAHEINNPITGIIGYSELLGLYKEVLPPKVNDITSKIQKESYRVKNIIENLLKFSRRQQLMDMSFADLSQSLKEVIFLLTTAFEEHNINFEFDIPEELPLIYCNSGLLQQAVLNLLQNSFDAITSSKKGDKISLKVYETGGKLYIETTDNGPGIPPEIRDKIFEPFFTTKIKGKGTGLGLSLIHRIVQIHGGDIYFDTSPEGTKFIISLPVNAQPMPQKEEEHKKETISPSQIKKALIIDDDATIREYLADILYTFRFSVDEATTAKEGINLISCNEYDSIIIDLKLPDKSGVEIFNFIMDTFPEKVESVIFITGDVSLDAREKLKKTRRPFLIKPFTFSDIVNILGLK
ncbi:MAG: hypothetical protein OHK0040_02830 [bacterium]